MNKMEKKPAGLVNLRYMYVNITYYILTAGMKWIKICMFCMDRDLSEVGSSKN